MSPDLGRLLRHVRFNIDDWIASEKLRRRSAPDFNLFDFLRSDEVGLSTVIAWLLDPSASHGHGADFLKAFVARFGVVGAPQDLDSATVATEAATFMIERRARRLDVRVRIGPFVMALENKPWAAWQTGQVRDYLEHLSLEADRSCLVVIKPKAGDLPFEQICESEREAAIESGRLIDGDYGLVCDWLRDCATASATPEMKLLLVHLGRKAAEILGEDVALAIDRNVTRGILADDGLRHSAFDLLAAKGNLMVELAEKAQAEIVVAIMAVLGEACAAPIAARGAFDPKGRWGRSSLFFDFDVTAPFILVAGFNLPDLRGFYIGLEMRDGAEVGARETELYALAQNVFGRDLQRNRTWVFWIDIEPHHEADPASASSGWERLASGETVKACTRMTTLAIEALKCANALPYRPADAQSGASRGS